jgi:hypothetical protein
MEPEVVAKVLWVQQPHIYAFEIYHMPEQTVGHVSSCQTKTDQTQPADMCNKTPSDHPVEMNEIPTTVSGST